MDSITQIVLGAAVTEAAIGRKVGNKAILWGAIAGTIPDLDVLAEHVVDNITALEIHRGLSHSIFFALILSPILGWILTKIYPKENATFKDWTFAMFLGLFTHPILDAFTTWGTQIFWPFDTRVAIKSIFVIDPLYTIPFATLLIWAMFKRKDDPKRRKLNNLGLWMSSSYLALAIIFKAVAYHQFTSNLDKQQIEYSEIETRPSPLNSILWMANVKTEEGFRTAEYSLFDSKDIRFSEVLPKQDHLIKEFETEEKIQTLKRITKGWYTIEQQDDKLIFNDLRFGRIGLNDSNAPFAFSFELFYDENGNFQAPERPKSFKQSKGLLPTLIKRIAGN